MKRIRVTEQDVWLMDITDEEYTDLVNGNVDVTELLEDKRDTDDLYWKNGFTDWE